MFEDDIDGDERPVEPVTPFSKLGQFLKNNLIHLMVGLGIIVVIVAVLTNLRGCPDSRINVSVPDEWIQEYYDGYSPEGGSASYSFFANMVRGLTQEALVRYDLDELTAENYENQRYDYIFFNSNLKIENDSRTLLKPNNVVYVTKVGFDLPMHYSVQDYRDFLSQSLIRMENYGMKPYSDLMRRIFDENADQLMLTFSDDTGLLVDSELILNLFAPLNPSKGQVPFKIDTAKSTQKAKRLELVRQNAGESFNNGIRFHSSSSNPRKDVEKNTSSLGFYLKYRDIPPEANFSEVDLKIGKVYMLWSPNIPANELQWISQKYIRESVEKYYKDNKSIQPNDYWLPSGYPKEYVDDEVWLRLELVDNLKTEHAAAFKSGKPVQIYYDTNDIRPFVDHLVSSSDSGLQFKKGQVISAEALMEKAASFSEPLVYIYGVSLHSMYNLPTEVISRSFWYKSNQANDLRADVKPLVDNFGEVITVTGEVSEQEFQQYADLELALCLGLEGSNRKGGWQPLFTVPYALFWDKRDMKSMQFNSSRGFISLMGAKEGK